MWELEFQHIMSYFSAAVAVGYVSVLVLTF